MSEDKYNTLDIALKALTFLGLIVGAVWAGYTYIDTKEKEFYTTFWNQKLTLFMQTSEAASTMATTDSVDEFKKAQAKFWQLFYGQLSLVEGSDVKEAMQSFAGNVPKDSQELPKLPASAMQQPAYRLTLQLKEELGRAWRAPFGEL
jgi:hypothetical protein